MQEINNMGSLLQAYALKKILSNLGNSVEFLDIQRREEDYILLGDYRKKFDDESEGDAFCNKIDKFLFNRIKMKNKCLKQHEIFSHFRQEQLDVNKKSKTYDLCVIGSDEVFNCLGAGKWGFTTQLFGNVIEANEVITYAASCGFTVYDNVPLEIINRIKKAFERIKAFSARDKNTHLFISKLTNKAITDNLDPVLVYNFTRELEQTALPALPERYCIVYSYYNRIHDENEIQAILNFCKENKLTPIAIGAPQFWISDYIVCTPFQCLKIFERSSYVITDTFHGTIFSAKYAKKFAILIRESNKNKLSDLVEKLNIQEHLIDNMNNIGIKYKDFDDRTKLENIMQKEYQHTLTYLMHNTNKAT